MISDCSVKNAGCKKKETLNCQLRKISRQCCIFISHLHETGHRFPDHQIQWQNLMCIPISPFLVRILVLGYFYIGHKGEHYDKPQGYNYFSGPPLWDS